MANTYKELFWEDSQNVIKCQKIASPPVLAFLGLACWFCYDGSYNRQESLEPTLTWCYFYDILIFMIS